MQIRIPPVKPIFHFISSLCLLSIVFSFASLDIGLFNVFGLSEFGNSVAPPSIFASVNNKLTTFFSSLLRPSSIEFMKCVNYAAPGRNFISIESYWELLRIYSLSVYHLGRTCIPMLAVCIASIYVPTMIL